MAYNIWSILWIVAVSIVLFIAFPLIYIKNRERAYNKLGWGLIDALSGERWKKWYRELQWAKDETFDWVLYGHFDETPEKIWIRDRSKNKKLEYAWANIHLWQIHNICWEKDRIYIDFWDTPYDIKKIKCKIQQQNTNTYTLQIQELI